MTKGVSPAGVCERQKNESVPRCAYILPGACHATYPPSLQRIAEPIAPSGTIDMALSTLVIAAHRDSSSISVFLTSPRTSMPTHAPSHLDAPADAAAAPPPPLRDTQRI